MKYFYANILFFFSLCQLFGQQNSHQQMDYPLHIKKTNVPLNIDGNLDENVWQNASMVSDFWQKFPRAGEKAHLKTEVMGAYDDNFLYFGVILHEKNDEHIIQTLKRDVDYWDSDAFGVILDPVNEKTYGFMFGVSPMGVQMEGLLEQGGEDLNRDWDNRWFVEVQSFEDKWVVEMAIPFKTLRYEANKTIWGINFLRNDAKHNEYHTWTDIPQQFNGIDLGYTGALIWDAAPKKVKGNVSIIPYTTGSMTQDFEASNEDKTNWDGDVGLDTKIAITSSLNLDLTYNPDFSQIEVDQQVTNLTRFSIFLPEKRTFFLENSDIFSGFGIPPARPFFTRRIGLDEAGQPIPILFGARLSGNVDKHWRLGVMNISTRKTDEQLAQNYSAVAFQRRVLKRSAIKGIVTNRQGFDEGKFQGDDYGRNASLELNYSSEDGSIFAWTSYHHSFAPNVSDKAYMYSLGGGWNSRNFEFFVDYFAIGSNYQADMGFLARVNNYDAERDTVIRLGYSQIYSPFTYKIIIDNENSKINRHNISLENYIQWDYRNIYNERNTNLSYEIFFKNSSELGIGIENNYLNLLFPFSFIDETPLPAQEYRYTNFGVSYESDERKPFLVEAEMNYGGFYNGTIFSALMSFRYRTQPWGNFALEFEYNNLAFPDPYGEADLIAISPRIDIYFNRNIFWTTWLQYNTQAENFNINSRFQWRFAPMSDLFLVYTDNYLVETEQMTSRFRVNKFGPKNRALVFKLNYWLTL